MDNLYGGFLAMTEQLQQQFSFGTVYHNGLGRFNGEAIEFRNGEGMSQLGPVIGTQSPNLFLKTLIDDFADVRSYSRLTSKRKWKLTGSYGTWLRELEKQKSKGVKRLMRVHSGMGTLPHFAGGPDTSVRVLGPVEETYGGKPVVRFLDGTTKSKMKKPSLTRNGISVVMRIDYGDVRLLMTGDLNFRSQALLLQHIPSVEFKCHVAKACHHGSEDISTTFLRAMSPLATLFSSGDNETHAHPRAKVLGMAGAFTDSVSSGMMRYLSLEERKHVAPLIYSTELSRSVALFEPSQLEKAGQRITGTTLGSKGAGGRKGPTKKLKDWLLADSLTYGLVNVRTDGKKVVIGVMKEGKGAGFQTETFRV